MNKKMEEEIVKIIKKNSYEVWNGAFRISPKNLKLIKKDIANFKLDYEKDRIVKILDKNIAIHPSHKNYLNQIADQIMGDDND